MKNNFYRAFTKINRKVRKKHAKDPFEKLKNYGIIGIIGNKLVNKITEPKFVKAARFSTGVLYKKGKDSPYIGSLLYSVFYFIYRYIGFIFISTLISFLIFLRCTKSKCEIVPVSAPVKIDVIKRKGR